MLLDTATQYHNAPRVASHALDDMAALRGGMLLVMERVHASQQSLAAYLRSLLSATWQRVRMYDNIPCMRPSLFPAVLEQLSAAREVPSHGLPPRPPKPSAPACMMSDDPAAVALAEISGLARELCPSRSLCRRGVLSHDRTAVELFESLGAVLDAVVLPRADATQCLSGLVTPLNMLVDMADHVVECAASLEFVARLDSSLATECEAAPSAPERRAVSDSLSQLSDCVAGFANTVAAVRGHVRDHVRNAISATWQRLEWCSKHASGMRVIEQHLTEDLWRRVRQEMLVPPVFSTPSQKQRP